MKRKRRNKKKGLDYTKKLVDVLHIPGKNQSVSIGSVHFLSTAPNLVQIQFLIFLFLLFGPFFSPSTQFKQPRPFPVRRIEIDPNPKLSNTHKHATHSTHRRSQSCTGDQISHTLDRISVVMTPGLAFRGKALCYRDNSVYARKEGKAGRETRDGASYLFFSPR